jgi:hypothetical protein
MFFSFANKLNLHRSETLAGEKRVCDLWKPRKSVIRAKAGIHVVQEKMDPRFRGNDKSESIDRF